MDERGSKQQRLIYDLTSQLYPNLKVEHEYPIGELSGQRIDIFVPTIGLAIEVHGIQHYKYNSFFFKDAVAWNNSVALDNKKVKYLKSKGVKLIEIPYNSKIKTVEELRELIDSVPYPDVEYIEVPRESSYELAQKEKVSEYNKESNRRKAVSYQERKQKEREQRRKEKQEELDKIRKPFRNKSDE